jgi:hypothetical protein
VGISGRGIRHTKRSPYSKLFTELIYIIRHELPSIIGVPSYRLTMVKMRVIIAHEFFHRTTYFRTTLISQRVSVEVVSCGVYNVEEVLIATYGLREGATQVTTKSLTKVGERITYVFRECLAAGAARVTGITTSGIMSHGVRGMFREINRTVNHFLNTTFTSMTEPSMQQVHIYVSGEGNGCGVVSAKVDGEFSS